MAATGPEISTDPIELLTPDLSRPEPFMYQFWSPTVYGIVGFTAFCLWNYQFKRPLFSGIHRHLLFGGALAAIGYHQESNKKIDVDENFAILRHYVELHPEDFPVPERKKYSEVLLEWVPIR